MTPDEGLILPNLVPVTKQLILSPEAERERAQMLAELEAAEEERRAGAMGDHDPVNDTGGAATRPPATSPPVLLMRLGDAAIPARCLQGIVIAG
mgnify:CR=1 FL=1